MSSKMGLTILNVLMVLLVACAKSTDDKPQPAVASDLERPIGEPRFAFQQEKQDINATSLSSSEISELMSCSEKSTSSRADRKEFKVSYGSIHRERKNNSNSIVTSKYDYSTENREEVYELVTTITEWVIAGRPVLANGPIAFRDSCTVSGGCDPEKRSFVTGNASYMMSTNIAEDRIRQEVEEDGGVYCELKKSKDESDVIQKGQIKLGELNYKAIQATKKKSGKIYCSTRSSRKSVFLGDGFEVSKAIVLQDELVGTKGDSLSEMAAVTSRLGCSRTVVFGSNELQFEGNTIVGMSSELVDYQFTGKVTSLEEWNKKQDDIKQNISKLNGDIVSAKADLDRSQLSVNQAESDLKTAESKLAELKLKLNEAVIGKKPEEDLLRGLVKDAEVSVDSSKARVESARSLLVKAQVLSKSAEEKLQAFVRENGTGDGK